MPCDNTLAPAVGCRGPGTDSVCDFCWDIEKKRGSARTTQPRPGQGAAGATKTTVPITKPLPKPPVTPVVTAVPGTRKAPPPIPLRPAQALAMVIKAQAASSPLSVKTPGQLPCGKKPPPKPPPYALVRLEVERACGAPGSWWQVVSADQTVQVKAVTSPPSPSAWGQLDWGTNITEVSRSGAGPQTVSCRMNSDPAQSVDIEIYDVAALVVSGGFRGESGKLYESNADLVVTATTSPDQAKVWSQLKWESQIVAPPASGVLKPGARPNERKVDQSTARDVKVAVTLGCNPAWGQKKVETTIHICRWPLLEVQEVEFDSRPVLNDGTAEIGQPFDRKWIKGRKQPAKKQSVADSQSPICYPRSSPVTVSATFNVTRKPIEDETLWVSGVAACNGKTLAWQQQVTVRPGDATVTIAHIVGSDILPDQVLVTPLTIEWHMTEPDNKTWKPIGSTTNLLYVTLGEPATAEAYWTLLAISCTAAAGTKDEDAFVPAAFKPFSAHTGDGNGFKREGDGVELSYYKQGVKTDGSEDEFGNPFPDEMSVYCTTGILARPDGTGRCGGWAHLLTRMFALHGVVAVRDYAIVRRTVNNGAPAMYNRFLVKNCNFSKGSLTGHAPYTHRGQVECVKTSGAAGQGKTNPQFDFGDHVFVEHKKKFYDPSYGIGPVASQFEYEELAIDGLGTMAGVNPVEFVQAGTPQFMSTPCSPGYLDCEIAGAATIHVVAARFGKTAKQVLDHPFNATLKGKCKGNVGNVAAGDVVYVPREWLKAGKHVMLKKA
jgi:hypothetical protein